jgi:flavin-binding protein dodecin
MMEGLATTNVMLGIMAAVSVLEALVIIGAAVAGYFAYRQVMTVVSGIEERQVAPAMVRLNALLDDLRAISMTVKDETDRVDSAIRNTMDRVDDTAERVRWNVMVKTSRIIGIVRGARVALEHILSRAA